MTTITPVLTVTATTWATNLALSVPVLSLSIREDVSWTPRTQVELTVPAMAAVLALDPRAGITLTLTVAHDSPSTGVPVSVTWRLLVTEITSGDDAPTVRAQSLDFLMGSWESAQVFYEGTPLIDYYKAAISSVASGLPVPTALRLPPTMPPVGQPGTPLLGVRSVDPVRVLSPAEVLAAATEAADLVWYADRDGTWVLENEQTTTSTPALTLSTGLATSTMTARPKDSIDLASGDYANRVIVGYGDNAVGIAEITTGPNRVAVAPRVTKSVLRGMVATTANTRTKAAQRIVKRMVSYGRARQIDAVAEPQLRVTDTLRVTHEGVSTNHMIRSISWSYPAADMTVITRTPDPL